MRRPCFPHEMFFRCIPCSPFFFLYFCGSFPQNYKKGMRIQIINGPNINLLGKREPGIYGAVAFEDYLQQLRAAYPELAIDYYQSNIEGEMIDKIQEVGFDDTGIVLNAGAYTHTSIALQDAIRAVTAPVVEVHISNVHKREEFRHNSMTAPVCEGQISGLGIYGYRAALDYLAENI